MISAATKKKFRALGHNLKPVVLLGAKGLSDNVLDEINTALEAHELIKVKIAAGEREDRRLIIKQICENTEAELIQAIGKIALLFKPSSKAIFDHG